MTNGRNKPPHHRQRREEMTNPKTVKEVLVKSMFKRILHEWNPSIPSDKRLEFFDKIAEDTQLHLDALYKARYLGMLPEEKEYQKGHNAFNESVEFTAGFNSAIQEYKRRVGL
jgi:hypothetical protein